MSEMTLPEAINALTCCRHETVQGKAYSYIGIHRTEASDRVLDAARVLAEIIGDEEPEWWPPQPWHDCTDREPPSWGAASTAIREAIRERAER
jgi:hypothetical protein